MNEKVKTHKHEVITNRNVNFFNVVTNKEDLENAPWQVRRFLKVLMIKLTIGAH